MAATSTAKKSSSAPARMPIEDYDRLSVKAILPRLTTLNGPELEAVVAHEKAGKNRVTLLQAVRKVELAREAASLAAAPAEPPHRSWTTPTEPPVDASPSGPRTTVPERPRARRLDDGRDLDDDELDRRRRGRRPRRRRLDRV